MFDCKEVVTVWNRWRDPETGKDEFLRHVITVKCKWRRQTRTNKGTVVIVPFSARYRPFEEWTKMERAERERFFTFQEGDLIAAGDRATEITGVSPCTQSQVKVLYHPRSIIVREVSDNTKERFGGHYRITGA